MVPPDQVHVVRVAHLIREEQADGFHALLPAIDEITHYEIFFVRWRASTLFHQPQKIIKLPMKIPTNANRRLNLQERLLSIHEHVFCLVDEEAHVLVLQLHLRVDLVTIRLLQLLYYYFNYKLLLLRFVRIP